MALVNRKKQQQQPLHSHLNLKSSATSNITTRQQQEFTFSGVGGGGEYSSSLLKNIILALILSPFVYFGISNTAFLQKGHPPKLGTNVIDSSSSSSQIRVEDVFALGIEFDKTTTTSSNNSTHNSSHEKVGNTNKHPHYSLGTHTITLNINMGKDMCQVPQVWTRIVGDALVNVPLTRMTTRTALIRTDTIHHEIWTGQFHLPLAGWYRLETTWKMTSMINNDPSCRHGDASNLSMVGKENVQHYDFVVMGNAKEEEPEKKIDGGISMVQGSWIAATKIKDVSSPPSFPYVWANPIMVEKSQAMTNILKSNTNGTTTTTWMLKESTVTQKYQFYDFQKLSNYELVCWIGSQSAQDIWDSFKALRRELFPHQRPFKFHYYKATSFVDPDRDWKDNTAFRKCKHILISLDEPEPQQQGKPLSKMEYKDQVTTFIKHLLNAFDQEHTFPALIWMFTTMESPMDAVHCYEDDSERRTATTNRTNIHPCNQVLLDLFQNNSPFPSDRVRLLDNTDLTDPIWRRRGEDVNANTADATTTAITMAIALRIYIIVGHQVKLWRDVGQVGGIHGLTRNGVTEPNFELVRYDWSQKIM